jgi:integrase
VCLKERSEMQDLKETRYSKHGKITTPIDDAKFIEGMAHGVFKNPRHRSYAVLLYYTAIRRAEALRCIPEQFTIKTDRIIFDVKKRLKHGKETPPLTIPRDAPFVDELENAVRNTEKGKRIWSFCPKTAYNIVDRAFGFYPHFFRLSRVTNFFQEGWTIAQVRSWTGLTLSALEYYVGLVDIDKMGMSLK